jgi:integrase
MIATGKRPHETAKRMREWINDDKTVRDLLGALAPLFREMFHLGNRAGLRNGEVRGLRMSDFDFLDEGVIRVRHSDHKPLKEDKKGAGKTKWVPSPDDIHNMVGPLLAKRRAQGAQPEDYVFAPELTRCALDRRMGKAWREARDALGLTIGCYEATRHSMISRNLAASVSLDEVSAAVGHSDTAVTRRYYDHLIRKTFSDKLRAGIGAKPTTEESGKTLSFTKPAGAR